MDLSDPGDPGDVGDAGPGSEPSEPGGRLVLAATPIGDPADAPARLAGLLQSADLVAAEDTRRLRRLADALGVQPRGRLVSYHEHNEAARTQTLLDAVRGGQTVLLVTDAGMPSVSDPGLRAVRAAVAAELPVTVVPGPSAVLTALALSGLATDRFCFEGFLPRRPGERRRALAELAAEPRTMVFFEAPHRAAAALADLAEVFGPDRPAAACRELTKTYEEVRREGLGELAQWAAQGVRGELTVVVAGRPEPDQAELAGRMPALVEQVRARTAAGERTKDAVTVVAAAGGVRKRELYAAVVSAGPQAGEH